MTDQAIETAPALTEQVRALVRKDLATELYMKQVVAAAASGHPDDIKIRYINIILANWRSRIREIEAGRY